MNAQFVKRFRESALSNGGADHETRASPLTHIYLLSLALSCEPLVHSGLNYEQQIALIHLLSRINVDTCDLIFGVFGVE